MPDTLTFVVWVIVLCAFLAVFALAVKIVRMRISKEWGLLKRHWRFRPARPTKQYTIRK